MNRIYLPFDEAKLLINEADILLFRGGSFFVSRCAEGIYTHVAIASWHNGNKDGLLEAVEFHEKFGGRTVNLEQYNKVDYREIDVYRCVERFDAYEFDADQKSVKSYTTRLQPKNITMTMRQMTGLPYGWRRIWWIAKHKLAVFRLFYNMHDLINDKLQEVIYPVCSTTLAYSFSKYECDLVKNRADEWTEPSHIASSARLSYLFSLAKTN